MLKNSWNYGFDVEFLINRLVDLLKVCIVYKYEM